VDTKLIDALNIFVEKRISAPPVVTVDGYLVDIYAKFDVINLAATQTYNNLDITVLEALHYRKGKFEGVATCRKTDLLSDVIKIIVNAGVHRLVIVDDFNHVIGVVSLSDLLKFLIIDPH